MAGTKGSGQRTAKKFGIKSEKDIERIVHEVRGV